LGSVHVAGVDSHLVAIGAEPKKLLLLLVDERL